MPQLRIFIRTAMLLAVISVTMLANFASAQAHTIHLSLRPLKLMPHERIIGIELTITGAAFTSGTHLPVGWWFDIDNDPSWTTSFEAAIEVGTAALDGKALNNFIALEAEPASARATKVEGVIVVTSDFEHVREIKVEEKDFILQRSSKAPKRLRKEHEPE